MKTLFSRIALQARTWRCRAITLTNVVRQWLPGVALALAAGAVAAGAPADRGAYDWNTARVSAGSIAWTVRQARPNWMASLPNSTPLGALSIPGTHDSLSLFNTALERDLGWPTADWLAFGATQWMDVRRQLQTGVRFLDLRFRHVNNKLAAHHGQVFQGLWAEDVFAAIQGFLQYNQSETVVVRVREEYSAEGNSRSFAQTLESVMARYPGLFWSGGFRGRVPTLGEVRGQVVLLQNFDGADYAGRLLGLDYGRMAFVRDDWDVPYLSSLPVKWRSVQQFADQARRDIELQDRFFYINFLSGTGWFMPPWAVASGQRSPNNGSGFMQVVRGVGSLVLDAFPSICIPGQWYCTDDYIGSNYLFLNWMRLVQPTFVGIVVADYPGPALIQTIIDANQRFALRRYGYSAAPVAAPTVQATTAPVASVDIRTGPIFSNPDAQAKCPSVCAAAGRRWNMNWLTVVPGLVSVCGCQ